MSLRHLFFPEKISFPDTSFNKNISLHRFFSQPTLFADGLIESGDIMSHIWGVGIKKLLPKSFVPQKILLLGLGGGSNAHLVARRYPSAQITAVEIDSQMVAISRKYFRTDKIKNLKIVVADAEDFAKRLTPKDYYDLILVDCFLGQSIPLKLERLDFVRTLRNHGRFVLFNRIAWYEHRPATMRFLRTLATEFFFITASTRSNLLFSLV